MLSIKEEDVEASTAEGRGLVDERAAGALAALAAIGAGALANFGNLGSNSGDNGGAGPFFIGAAAALVLAAILYLGAVPRWRGSTRAAIVLAVLALVSLGAFWSGAPEVFAPAAIVVALDAPRSGARTMAIVIASLALLAGVVAALFG